jgi:hypothetical protein
MRGRVMRCGIMGLTGPNIQGFQIQAIVQLFLKTPFSDAIPIFDL